MTLGNQKGIQIALKVKKMDEIVKNSGNILKNVTTFKQMKEELCAEGLPVNSYCPIQTPIDQNIFAVNADKSPRGDTFSCSDISDNESKHIFSNEEIQNLLTDYYKGEAQFKGNCRMGTENFIQSEVS